MMKSAPKGKNRQIPSAYAKDFAKYELTDMYLKDGAFSSGFEQIWRKHDTVLTRLLNSPHDLGVIDEGVTDDQERLLLETLERDAPRFYRMLELTTIIRDLERIAADRHIDVENLLPDRFPPDCVDGVLELAADIGTLTTRFGFDYPWAVPRLLSYAIMHADSEDTDEAEVVKSLLPLIPIHVFRSLERTIERPPLSIQVPAALVLWGSEFEIIEMMRQLLRAYKQKLKKEGFPLDTKDGLSRQIGWLFLHKRHGLSAAQIVDRITDENGQIGQHHMNDVLTKWKNILGDQASGGFTLNRQRRKPSHRREGPV